ncbi:feruloyl-CoA synthase [Microbulbifer sp.]|uniref:feruloyl-CoA synthase n=1 Tax=Microbulbifer sp. TaxID=1908541 RepID=UPI003F3106E3
MTGSSSVSTSGTAAYRPVPFFSSDVVLERVDDQVQIMRSTEALGRYNQCLGEWLDQWAEDAPDRRFIVEQTAHGEVSITYRQARERVLSLAEELLPLNLGSERPIVLLSENSIDCALVMLGALYVGIPVAPIAPAYALQAKDHEKLKDVFRLLTPGLVVVEDGGHYRQAIGQSLSETGHPEAAVVAFRNPVAGMRDIATLCGDGSRLDRVYTAAEQVSHATIAKFLFTSGSSGAPKAVINTHGMLCAAAQQQQQISPSIAADPPVMIDWLPWNHTAGGNSNFNITLYNGGTLYIDPGKPTVEQIGKSVELLKRVSPTLYFNVPMGYDALLPYLEKDQQLRHSFFRHLKFLWYAAASMQASTWAALDRLAMETVGERILMVTGLGMTETSPVALFGNKRANGPGVVGVPAPGVTMKMVHFGDGHWEARYRGPNVTPGYWRAPKATAESFDEEGYFKSGDLVSFVNPTEPADGLRFEGRQSEDFKLTSGTRVAAGTLRLKVLAAMPKIARDLVIMGDGQADVRALILPNWEACAAAAGLPITTPPRELARSAPVKALFNKIITELAASDTGSSKRVVAGMLVDVPLSESAGEITPKGSINRRVLQRNRPELVATLYEHLEDDRVICAGGTQLA